MLLKDFYLNTFLILLISYLIGSLLSAFIAAKLKKKNILKIGTGNVGGMNTIIQVGKIYGIIVAIIDIGKGALAAFLASKFSTHQFIPLLAVVFAIIGHNWMIFIKFKGGSGVATFVGGLLYLSPLSILFLYLLFVPAALILTKDTYISSALSFFFLSFFLWVREGSFWWVIFGLLVTLVYAIKCRGLIKTYFTTGRRDISPVIKKLFKPFFKGI